MPRYLCPKCRQETTYYNVSRAAQMAQVTRATVYKWIEQDLVHVVLRPSGRSFVCENSLVRPGPAHVRKGGKGKEGTELRLAIV